MEHVHNWVVKSHSPGIGKGACLCGAARYYPTCFDKEYEEAARELNRKEAKKEVVAQKEEVATVAGKQEDVRLPPVPPRPDKDKQTSKQYYDTNKDQILAEIKEYGCRDRQALGHRIRDHNRLEETLGTGNRKSPASG